MKYTPEQIAGAADARQGIDDFAATPLSVFPHPGDYLLLLMYEACYPTPEAQAN